MTEDPNARVRSYLLSQAERYDWTALWPRVMQPRLDLVASLEGVTEEQAWWRPAPDVWSIAECAQHILQSSRNNRSLIEGLLRGELRSDNPDAPLQTQDTPLTAVREGLIEDGARFGALITQVPEDLDLELRIPHNMFGPLNAREWFLFQRLHDVDHTNQIRAVREADGFPTAEE